MKLPLQLLVYHTICGNFIVHALPQVPLKSTSTAISRLIVFGDSFSDNGNGSWVASNGSWPADPAYYSHSFSNGPKWNDYVAKDLSINLVNLAAGGATADNSFVAGGTGPESTIPVPSATDQVISFLSWDAPRPGDVFVHWIGANDILFNTSITGAEITTFPATYNSSDYNVPSVQSFNDDLSSGLRAIAAAYSAYGQTAFVDVAALYRDISADPGAYGIAPEYVDPPTACLTGVYTSEGVLRRLCADVDRHLFFDIYHPTTGVHKIVAGLFEQAIRNFLA